MLILILTQLIKFSIGMSIGEISPITILKIDYGTEDLRMILKSLLTLTSSIFGGLGFQYSCEWYIGLVELLKRNYLKGIVFELLKRKHYFFIRIPFG